MFHEICSYLSTEFFVLASTTQAAGRCDDELHLKQLGWNPENVQFQQSKSKPTIIWRLIRHTSDAKRGLTQVRHIMADGSISRVCVQAEVTLETQ